MLFTGMKRALIFVITGLLVLVPILGYAQPVRGMVSQSRTSGELQGWRQQVSDAKIPGDTRATAAVQLGRALFEMEGQIHEPRRLATQARAWALSPATRVRASILLAELAHRTRDIEQFEACQKLLIADLSRAKMMMPSHVSAWRRAMRIAKSRHQKLVKLGVPTMAYPNPECGLKAFQIALKGAGVDKTSDQIKKLCPTAEVGSGIDDLRVAAEKLGLKAWKVQMDARLLKTMPQPVIAYIDQSRFVAVLRADDKGVTYRCGHCETWPGATQKVSWEQWGLLEPSVYLAIASPESDMGRALSYVFGETHEFTTLSSLQTGLAQGDGALRLAQMWSGQMHLVSGFFYAICGFGVTGTAPAGPPYGRPAKDGDPVVLATGEETFETGSDLSAYNPIGPSVSVHRIYRSYNGQDNTSWNPTNCHNRIDFGRGFSHNFNTAMYDPNFRRMPKVQVTRATTLNAITTDTVPNGWTWEVIFGGATVASSATPNGWAVTRTSTTATVTPPSGASLGLDYRIRWTPTGVGSHQRADFDVVSITQIARSMEGLVHGPGTEAPDPALSGGTTWDILLNGSPVATSANPGEWKIVNFNTSTRMFTIQPPMGAAISTLYKVRRKWVSGSTQYASGNFEVQNARPIRASGTKTFRFANNRVASVVAATVPTAGTPVVAGVPDSGTPMLFNWRSDIGNGDFGCWEITYGDQTTWRYEVIRASSDTSTWMNYWPTRITNRLGQFVTIQYYSATNYTGTPALISSIKDSNGQALLTFNRDSGTTPRILSLSDRYNRSVYFTYSNSLLSTVSQIVPTGTSNPPLRNTYGYPATGTTDQKAITSITEPSPTGSGNAVTTFVYDATTGVVLYQTDALGNKREYTAVNAATTRVTVKDPGGTVVNGYQVTFDSQLRELTRTDGTNSTIISTLVYGDADNPSQPSQVKDGENRTWTYDYDTYGNVLTTTTPRGVTTTNTYNYGSFAMGRLVSSQTGSLTPVTYTYHEPSGLIASVTTASPTGVGTVATSYTYDALGNVLTVTEPGNNAGATHTTTYNYTTDGAYSQAASIGQLLRVINPLGEESHLRYDSQGRVVKIWDHLGNTTDTTYNLAGQATEVLHPATGQTGAGRAKTTFAYVYPGAQRKEVKEFNEAGAIWRTFTTTYDLAGRVLSVSGIPESKSYTYDADNRLKTVTDGAGRVTTYNYNAAGYPSSTVLPGGDTTTFNSYDLSGRLTQMTTPKGDVINNVYADPDGLLTAIQHPTQSSLNQGFSFDALGRMQSMTDEQGSESYTYNDLGMPVTQTRTYTGLPAKTLTYSYYPDGSRATLATPAGNFSYTYDAAGRNTSLVNPYAETTTWSYLGNGWMSQQTLGNAAYTTYGRNARGQLTSQTNYSSAGAVLSSYGSFVYDASLNLKSVAATVPGFTGFSGTDSYTFDGTDRLTQQTSTRSGGFTHNFGFDGANNLTTFKGASVTYNTKNQLTVAGMVYDLNGNPTTYKGSALTFNQRDMMTAYGAAMTAGYDGGGSRAWKQVGAARTYFLYDGDDPVIEMDSAGTVTAVNTFGANGLVSRRSGGSSVFYQFDERGTTAQRLNSASTVLSYHRADVYGTLTSSVATTDPYAGHRAQLGYYRDAETGLYLCGARYYDPAYGRFINRDPIGQAGGLNLYGYAGTNPANLADPMGLCPSNGGDGLPLDIPDGVSSPRPRSTRPNAPRRRDFLDGMADFFAGFGDSATFGLTAKVRSALDCDDVVDKSSGAYAAGEWTEIAIEIGISAGGAAANKLATKAALQGVNAYADVGYKALKTPKMFRHHVNPLKGHPGGSRTMFPTLGLPASIRSSKANLRVVTSAEHLAAHRRLRKAEAILQGFVNVPMTGARVGSNQLRD